MIFQQKDQTLDNRTLQEKVYWRRKGRFIIGGGGMAHVKWALADDTKRWFQKSGKGQDHKAGQGGTTFPPWDRHPWALRKSWSGSL